MHGTVKEHVMPHPLTHLDISTICYYCDPTQPQDVINIVITVDAAGLAVNKAFTTSKVKGAFVFRFVFSLEFGVFGVLKIQNLQISHIAQFSILLWHSFTLSNAVFSCSRQFLQASKFQSVKRKWQRVSE